MSDERNHADPHVSVTDAAKALGVTRVTVYARIKRGELQGVVSAGRQVVLRESVEAAVQAKAA